VLWCYGQGVMQNGGEYREPWSWIGMLNSNFFDIRLSKRKNRFYSIIKF